MRMVFTQETTFYEAWTIWYKSSKRSYVSYNPVLSNETCIHVQTGEPDNMK